LSPDFLAESVLVLADFLTEGLQLSPDFLAEFVLLSTGLGLKAFDVRTDLYLEAFDVFPVGFDQAFYPLEPPLNPRLPLAQPTHLPQHFLLEAHRPLIHHRADKAG
jgi:hypothetical protein